MRDKSQGAAAKTAIETAKSWGRATKLCPVQLIYGIAVQVGTRFAREQPSTKWAQPALAFPCRKRHSSFAASSAETATRVSSRGRVNPALERSAIAPQLREDMLQLLAQNPDLRPRSRRTWEWFKKKTGCKRSADSLKTHAASKLFRMEQGGDKAALKRPLRLKIKKDMWKR